MSKFDINHEPINDNDIMKILNDDPEIIDIENYKFSNFLSKAKMKPDMKMMFGTYFQTGEICILFGKTGVGKSILAYQIADGISKGISILNQENETEPQKVLLYDFELNEGHIKKRYLDYEPNQNFLRPDVKDIMIENEGNFNFDIIANDIDSTGAKVIIIDNISAIALKSTQDPETAVKLMKDATMLKGLKDVSILIIAHTPKIKENRPLELYDLAGAAHISNFIDNAIIIGKSSQDIKRRYIKQVKNRNSIDDDKVLIVDINSQNWLHYDFVGYDDESKHLELNPDKEKMKKTELIELAENIFRNRSLRHIDFINEYKEQTGKTFDNAKKILKNMQRYNITIKDPDGKYMINRNEEPF